MAIKIPHKSNEIDEKSGQKLDQEILGNEIIRQLICNKAKEELSDTNIVYDHNDESFEDKITDSINDKYKKEESQFFIDFVTSVGSLPNRIPYEENEVRTHVENVTNREAVRNR
ncbi:MAG: hypothetical protein PQ612_08260 [Rickettsiales bacterium]|nr:hypothetical protein [Pseudomonadota bacterium]MDA0966786.1 hypothetical protein [Pseudomonadota bacterium]MDG4543458.1 hypothetical protein [Rickettsiales bacterium]MDG4546148.1 hypothetical protein [Rickettsiales bacterium]MDG4547621.1 hypothetical protein [Rickettsiales bacterium]